MTHPLADEVCRQLADTKDRLFTSIEMNNMRAAADWQLEQVIEWLKETEYHQYHHDKIIYASDLREAMRPTTQEDN